MSGKRCKLHQTHEYESEELSQELNVLKGMVKINNIEGSSSYNVTISTQRNKGSIGDL